MKKKVTEEIEIPQNIEIEISKIGEIKINGPKGKTSKILKYPRIKITKKENKIIITSTGSRNELKLINTFKSHIYNLIKGVIEGYVYELKICSGHFPITVEKKDGILLIKNFLGERVPRKAKILPEVNIEIKGDNIILESVSKESAGETASNIERATRITKRDRRRFQDGIFLTKKAGIPIR